MPEKLLGVFVRLKHPGELIYPTHLLGVTDEGRIRLVDFVTACGILVLVAPSTMPFFTFSGTKAVTVPAIYVG